MNKQSVWCLSVCLILCLVPVMAQSPTTALYRWYNSGNGDHFYTTDPTGELAPSSGYVSEGITGYVATSQMAGTTALFRWYNSGNGDHFYTTDPTGELAPSSGYVSEGITGYIATSQMVGTTALYRWYNSGNGDHFYTTDPTGELAPSSGYVSEGITGYIWTTAQSLNPIPGGSAQGETPEGIPETGLIAYYSFNDGTARDYSGNGNDGQLKSGASIVPGRIGDAVSLDGISGSVNVLYAQPFNTENQVTISIWMKPDVNNAMDRCCQGLVTTDYYGLEISGGADPRIGVNFFTDTSGDGSFYHTSDAIGGGSPVSPDQWHHVAGVYDGSNMRIFIDGSLTAERPQSGSLPPMKSTSFLSIGSEDGRTYNPSLVGTRYFYGLIDEVAIYNRALSADEVDSLYKATTASGIQTPIDNTGQTTVETLNANGLALYNQGKYDEAIQAFDKALNLNDMDAASFYNKGIALEAKGENANARQFLYKALDLGYPDNGLRARLAAQAKELENKGKS